MPNNNTSLFRLPNSHFILVAVSLAVAAFFRIRDLNRDFIGVDEECSVLFFISPQLDSFSFMDYFFPNNHIFHSILANLSGQVFDYHEISYRLPVLVFGLLAIPIIYWWVFLIWNSRETAFIASLFLTLSPIHVHYSQTARGYSLVIFFSLLAHLSLFKLLENFRAKWAIIFCLSNILNIFTIPSSSFFVASTFFSLIAVCLLFKIKSYWFDQESARYMGNINIKKIIIFLLLIFIPVALFYIPNLDQMSIQASRYRSDSFILTISDLIRDNFLIGLPAPLFLFCLIGCWFLYRERKFWGLLLILVFILPFILSFPVNLGGPGRVYLFGLPFLVLAFSIGAYEITKKVLAKLLPPGKTNIQLEGISTILIVLSLSLPLISFLEKNYYPPKRSFKYQGLKEYTNSFQETNNLIFSPFHYHFRIYLESFLEKNASGLFNGGGINEIYWIKREKSYTPLEDFLNKLSKKNSLLLKEFRDIRSNADYNGASIVGKGNTDGVIGLYSLKPKKIGNLMDNDFLETKWLGGGDAGGICAKLNPQSKQIEFTVSRDLNIHGEEVFVVSSQSSLKLKFDNTGFIFITYALNYPNISVKNLSEPLSSLLLVKDEKNKTLSGAPKFVLNNTVSATEVVNNRVWYIIQQVVPFAPGNYDIVLGFFIRLHEQNRAEEQKFFVRNFQAYGMEF